MISRQVVHKTSANSQEGVVVAARMQSAQAAKKMLEVGGNAVDAAVAAAFVAGVIEPMETSLYGSGFMLVALPGDQKVISIDFGPRAPLKAKADMFKVDGVNKPKGAPGISLSAVENNANVEGILAIGVPSNIRGLTEALARFGTLDLKTVMQPAITAAYEGFIRDSYFALEALSNLRALRADPTACALFLEDGLPPVSADLGSVTLGLPTYQKQPVLGKSLEMIAEKGPDIFYHGELGKQLLETVRRLGGLLEADDLYNCRAQVGDAKKIKFRDTEIWAPNGPCGAETMLQILQIWQALYPEGSPLIDSPQRFKHLANTIWHAFADRYHWLGDPDFINVPSEGILSSTYAHEIANQIRQSVPPPSTPSGYDGPWTYFSKHAAHDPWPHQENGRVPAPKWNPHGSTAPTSGTTHVSVIDRSGMSVSLTHTAANIFGSKVVCPNTGLLFDAAMGWFNAVPGAANSIAGGKRPLANMGPLMITRSGYPIASIGAPGGRRIISAVTQLAINIVDRKMDAEAALLAPRCDASGPDLLVSERLEPLIERDEELAKHTKYVSEQHEGFSYELARPLVATCDEKGKLSAAGDPFTRNFAIGI